MEFHRLQDSLPEGFIKRRHYCITRKVYEFAKKEQFKLLKKSRSECPTLADIYYQLIIQGLECVEDVTFKNLPNTNYKVRMKIGFPVNAQLLDIQKKITSEYYSSQRGYSKNGVIQSVNLFSIAVCLMEAAIDNQ